MGFYAEHLIVRKQPAAPVCFLILGLRRNSDRDKIGCPVLLQPAISHHSPPAVPRPRKVNCLRNPQDDARLVHPDFTVAVIEFRRAPLEEAVVHDRPERTYLVLDVRSVLEHMNGSAAHDCIRRLVDLQVKLRADHSGKFRPLRARHYGPVQRRKRDVVVELGVVLVTPPLPAVNDEGLVCVRQLRLAVVTTPCECFGRGEVKHRVGEMLSRMPQHDDLWQLRGALSKAYDGGPDVRWIQV